MQATARKIKGTTGRRRRFTLVHIILILGAFTMIFPFYWMIITSFKTVGESLLVPPTMWPSSWAPVNYQEVLRTLPMWKLYFNTILLIVLRIACAVVFSSMAAFAFAKLRFPLKGLLFFIVITQQMLPGAGVHHPPVPAAQQDEHAQTPISRFCTPASSARSARSSSGSSTFRCPTTSARPR